MVDRPSLPPPFAMSFLFFRDVEPVKRPLRCKLNSVRKITNFKMSIIFMMTRPTYQEYRLILHAKVIATQYMSPLSMCTSGLRKAAR